MKLRIALRIEYDLRNPPAVAHINKNNAAVITPSVNPSAQ
jgi:hypothetical protein